MTESAQPDQAPSVQTRMGMARLFRTSEPQRGAFLSRLFAFSEDVVRHWSACEAAPYRDVGRPVLRDEGGERQCVLDFTLERESDRARFVAEMKCEIEFEGYQYLTLNDFSQIEHHVNKAAFDKFLRLAPAPKALRVIVGGKEQETAGSVHVWGVVTAEGRASAMNRYHLADVLSVEDMLVDLAEWQPARWAD